MARARQIRAAQAGRLAGRDTGHPIVGDRVNLDSLTKEEVALEGRPELLLNGKILTGRDAAHKRIADMLAKGEQPPVDFTNRVIYYVGPVDPVRDEVVGPAGSDHRHPHGQVHPHHAGADRP